MILIGMDLETTGDKQTYALQPHRVRQGAARITSAAFIDEDGNDLWSGLEPTADKLREVLLTVASRNDNPVLVGWNVCFDVAFLIAYGLEKEVRACKWADGAVFRRLIDNDAEENSARKKKYGLKATVAQYLPEHAGYEEGVKFGEIDDTLLQYNKKDSGFTAKLAGQFYSQLDTRRRRLAKVICKSIIPVAKAWVEGIPLDPAAIDAWETDAVATRDVHRLEVINLGGLEGDDAENITKVMASWQQLSKYLHAEGIPVKATDKEHLSEYWHVPLVKAISDWKRQNTSVTKFITGMRKSLAYNGGTTTHPACRIWNTYTGRFGYTSKTKVVGKGPEPSGIAIHQFQRAKIARDCIVAPPGMKLWEYDFSTQESRLICDYSGDPVMLDIFQSGKNFHSMMGATIAGWDYEYMLDRLDQKDPDAINFRQLGKVANLSCQYRTGWKKLIVVGRIQYDVIFDAAQSQQLVRLYRNTYAYVPIFWDTAISMAKRNGYAETKAGRRCYLDDWSYERAWSSESTAINFPIQGLAADMKFLAIAEVEDMIHEAGGSYMLDLHDALFVLLPDTSAGDEVGYKIRHILSNLPYESAFGWKPRVALPVDAKCGPRWGSLQEVK